MKRKHVVFTAAILAVLWTGVNAYAYWVDKVEAKVKVSFEVPIAVKIIPAQPLPIAEEAASEGEPGQLGETEEKPAEETGNNGDDADKAHGNGNEERNNAEGGE